MCVSSRVVCSGGDKETQIKARRQAGRQADRQTGRDEKEREANQRALRFGYSFVVVTAATHQQLNDISSLSLTLSFTHTG